MKLVGRIGAFELLEATAITGRSISDFSQGELLALADRTAERRRRWRNQDRRMKRFLAKLSG
jgi:uncharacterized protein (DUF1778 family)